MKITSAEFIKSAVGTDPIFEEDRPMVAFIGRSNVGKSSVINSIANDRHLAHASARPGRTQLLNIFLINRSFYLIDLPGYGYAKAPGDVREHIKRLIEWYLFDSGYDQQKIVLIIDANVGPTREDQAMLESLAGRGRDVVVVANKIDSIKPSVLKKRIAELEASVPGFPLIPYSAAKKIGVQELLRAIL